MALQRSKSAPHPLSALSTTSTRTAAAALQRSVSAQSLPPYGGGPSGGVKHAQQMDRRDPFNLSGFFPAMRGGRAWNWLQEEETEQETGETKSSERLSSDMADGHVEEIIKHEDKMGVLSLGWMLGKAGEDEEDGVLLSPYERDEAVDYESLYLGMYSRRVSGERRISVLGREGAGYGTVFLGGQ